MKEWRRKERDREVGDGGWGGRKGGEAGGLLKACVCCGSFGGG